jgi:hypothetical protein
VSEQREKVNEQQRADNEAFFTTFTAMKDGQRCLEILEEAFMNRSMVKKDSDGVVDPFAMAVQCGAGEVVLYIKARIKNGKLARTPT